MWFKCLDELRRQRVVWLREIQPGLVVADQSVALLRVVLILTVVPFYRSCTWWRMAAVTSAIALGLSLVRYFYARCHPLGYARWRWLLVLTLSLTTALGGGNVCHCLAVPSSTISGYLKNLLLASGIALSVQAGLLDREIYYLSFLSSIVLVGALWQHAGRLCREGLLATEYSRTMTRQLFKIVATAIDLEVDLIPNYEYSALHGALSQADPAKDMPCCLCLVRTLLITVGFILPNALLYFYEIRVLEMGIRGRGQEDAAQGGNAWRRDPVGAWGVYGPSLLTVGAITLVGGTVTWYSLRLQYCV